MKDKEDFTYEKFLKAKKSLFSGDEGRNIFFMPVISCEADKVAFERAAVFMGVDLIDKEAIEEMRDMDRDLINTLLGTVDD